jgi:hypothetical protein
MLVDGPHFQATNEGEIVFLRSDGDDSRGPNGYEVLELEEEERTVQQNYYLHVPLDHPDSHRRCAEIVKYLAPLVLGNTYNLFTPYNNAHILYSPSSLIHCPISGHPPTFTGI